MMNSDLQSLIERACDLQEKLNEEINRNNNNTAVWFCNIKYYHSEEDEHKRFCKLDDETHRLIALRDSLKQVEDMLIHFQRMRAWHFINRQVAEKQVEESRAMLMEKVSEYEGKPHRVIDELNSNFGNGRRRSALDKRETKCFFLLGCMKFLCNPEKWRGVIGGAAKLIAASVTVSSTVYFYRRRHVHVQYCRSIPNSQLDVFKGRG